VTPEPWVSVIVPARDAAATIGETIASLRAQTMGAWEAVVVDDGSTDGTAAAAAAAAAGDGRLRVIAVAAGSASAARNAGIAATSAPRLLFLDADDWIEPDHLAALRAALEADPAAGAAYCGDMRVLPGGLRAAPRFAADAATRPMHAFARRNGVAIHAVVVNRAAVEAAGGFDPALATCEDWDLWQRLARLGLRFAPVERPLALYRIRPRSLSADWTRMLADARVVVARGFGADPRLAGAALAFPDGAPAAPDDGPEICEALFAAWCLGAAAGRGADAGPIIGQLARAPTLVDHGFAAGRSIADGLLVGAGLPEDRLAAGWDRFGPALDAALDAVERRIGLPGAAAALGVEVERALLGWAPDDALRPLTRIAAAAIPLGSAPAVAPGPGRDRALLRFTGAPALSGAAAQVETPLLAPLSRQEAAALAAELVGPRDAARAELRGGNRAFILGALRRTARRVAGRVLRGNPRAILDARRILGRCMVEAFDAWSRAPGPSGSNRAAIAAVAAQARAEGLAAEPVAAPAAASGAVALASREDRPAFWDSFFSREDPWDYGSPYEQEKYARTLALLPDEPVGAALEIGCAEGVFTRMLAPRVGGLTAVDISERALERARSRCADAPNVRFARFDLEADAPPRGLDLILCCELLYYLPSRQRLAEVAAGLADALAEGGRLIQAHAFVLSDDRTRTGFDWGHPFGADSIHEAFAAAPGLTLERSVVTELYRVDCFRKGGAGAPQIERAPVRASLTPEVERLLVRGGAVALRAEVEASERAEAVPVLMYHRIADEPDPARRRWAVSPQAFREQLGWLRRHGYRAIGSTELAAGLRAGTPFAGRPVLITFDDGYEDFAETAWPALRATDFTAEVFLVADLVGRSADWDRDGAPLMGWERIAALAREGARFGSHLCTHRRPATLSTRALAAELARSRAVIEARLGRPALSVAAPHGGIDDRFLRLAAAAGYETAFSTQPGRAALGDHPLKLRRLEVSGHADLAAFAALLTAR
jgi:peptidoglycan/xylan/chitin deacetylase (PgdA/CDA1 family)